MPSPDKLFRLDPVETKIAAPITAFQSLADAADRSIANRSINRGLASFGQALGGLAKFKKQEQIREDIKTAKDAAVRGEVMPDVFPIAERAYRDIVDINTSADTLASIERWENGSELDLVIKDHNMSSSDKTAGLEVTYDTYYAEAVQHGMNPETAQKLRLAINAKKEKSYQRVYEQEKNLRTIEGVHAVGNTLKDAKRFAELTKIPLTDTLTSDWVKNNAKDLGVSHPYISESERKLIVFQVLTSDADVMGDPDIIENIMKSEYSKGFTYENLLFGKGQDSEEMLKIYKAYVENSKAYFKDIEDKQKAADLANTNQVLDSVYKNWIGAGKFSGEGISSFMLASGQFTEAQANKKQKDVQKFMDNNIKFQRGSEEYQEALDMIQSQNVTLPSQVDDLVITSQLNPELGTVLKSYLTEEGNQKLKFIADYQNSIKDLSKNVLSLSKLKLKNKDIFTFEGREPTTRELLQAFVGSGLDHKQVELIVEQVQDLHNGMRAQAERMGIADSIADKADGSVPEENLAKFQNMMEQNIKKLAADIDKGLEEREDRFVNLDDLRTFFSPTQKEFPLIIKQSNNIFDKSAKELGKESSSDQSLPLDVSFDHNSNITLKSFVMDAVVNQDTTGMEAVVTKQVTNDKDFTDYISDGIDYVKGFLVPDKLTLQQEDKQLGTGQAPPKKLVKPPTEDILGSSSQLSPTDRAKMIASNTESQRGLNVTEPDVAKEKTQIGLFRELINNYLVKYENLFKEKPTIEPFKAPPEMPVTVGEEPISNLPEDIRFDLKRQQEDKLPSATPEFLESKQMEISKMESPVYDSTEQIEQAAPGFLSSLPKKTQEDIKRQLEGKLPSAAPELLESKQKVDILDIKKSLKRLIGDSTERNSLEYEETSGKRYNTMYPEDAGTKNIPTIGIGFNLKEAGAKKRIEDLGYNYDKVVSGKEPISNLHIDTLFLEDVKTSIKEAKSVFSNFNSLPDNVASVVTKMIFQLGLPRFKGFKNFIKAVKKQDWDKAAKEILTTTDKRGKTSKSPFHKQVPARANRLAKQITGK